MREQLLGYLLGALEPAEQQAVESCLEQDPELRRELEALREKLLPLADIDDGEPEPPPCLASRTCRFVMSRMGPVAGQFASNSQWRMQDIVVAAGIFVAAGMLLFPAVLNSRTQAQLRACEKNLLSLGRSLAQYSQLHDGRFPRVPRSGKLAVAGMYAPTLQAAGLLDPREVICPARGNCSAAEYRIPSVAEVETAEGDQLRDLQSRMGGSYCYAFGYVENGRYIGPRNRARATYAVMSDATEQHPALRSCEPECRGQNVLFEDGHVSFLTTCRLSGSSDHIFQNAMGMIGAGIGPDDAVVAPSGASPMTLDVLLDE